MQTTKRKRAVILALVAFFCTAASTYVAVDWKRFGGGFLAFMRGKGGPTVAATPGGERRGADGVRIAAADEAQGPGASLPRLAAADSRRHTAEARPGAGGGQKSDEDLFKYGDPAAGGIPPGRFIVADNDAGAAPGGGGAVGGPPVGSPAPQPESFGVPGPSNGGLTDSGLAGTRATPTAPPVTPTPPSPPAGPTPPAPPPSGNPDPGTPGGTPISAVPEASTTAMMALGALFLAVAAARQRKRA